MELEMIIAGAILLVLVFLATVDTAFSYLSDVGLRRMSSDEESVEKKNSVRFLREILENRHRFRFALSSTIQFLIVCFAVLMTVIVSAFAESVARVLVASIVLGLVSTVTFRQIVPRLIVRNNTERKLLFLLPAIRPIYSFFSFFLEPIDHRGQQRLERTIAPEASDDRETDNNEDFQALMEVGEAEGIIEEKER